MSIPPSTNNEFSVYQFFPNETYEELCRFVSAEKAIETAMELIKSLGAKMGTTRRIIITDGDDFTNFEWKFGEGVVFPPKPYTKEVNKGEIS